MLLKSREVQGRGPKANRKKKEEDGQPKQTPKRKPKGKPNEKYWESRHIRLLASVHASPLSSPASVEKGALAFQAILGRETRLQTRTLVLLNASQEGTPCL